MPETANFNVYPITPAVIHEVFRTKNKEEILRFFGIGEELYNQYLEMHQKGMETHRLSLMVFLMISKENGKPVGECGFHTWNRTHSRGEIFYHLRSDEYKRKGFMSEVLPVVLAYGFRVMNLNRVEAYVDVKNIPSVRLLQKNGFTKEGVARGHYFTGQKHEDSDFYSLLKDEWKSQKTN